METQLRLYLARFRLVGLRPEGEFLARSMISSPFPSHVAFVSLKGGRGQLPSLLPEEEALLSPNAAQKRREDFILGRAAARKALAELGLDPMIPILRGEKREPLWPIGIVGSISHTGGYAIAAAAKSSEVITLGIDIESLRRADEASIRRAIASPEEIRWIEAVGEEIATRTIITFSAKEALYKALFPLCKTFLDYSAASITSESTFPHEEVTLTLSARAQEIMSRAGFPGFPTELIVTISRFHDEVSEYAVSSLWLNALEVSP